MNSTSQLAMSKMTIEVIKEEDDGSCEIYLEWNCLRYGHKKTTTIKVKNLDDYVNDQRRKGYEVELIK
jgi:hypothetical protein